MLLNMSIGSCRLCSTVHTFLTVEQSKALVDFLHCLKFTESLAFLRYFAKSVVLSKTML